MNDISYQIHHSYGACGFGWWDVYIARESWMPWHVDGYRWERIRRYPDTSEGLQLAKEFVKRHSQMPLYYTSRGNATTFDTEED